MYPADGSMAVACSGSRRHRAWIREHHDDQNQRDRAPPNIEVVRRKLPDEGAEQIAIRVTAKPSFEAFRATLTHALPAMMAMNPALFWFGVWRQAAEPWLRLPAVPRDESVSRSAARASPTSEAGRSQISRTIPPCLP
jgi:hypothetical protein